MAAPVIDAVAPELAALAPGQFVDVKVTAHDPDSKSGSVAFPISDSQGNESPATVALRIDDPIVFGAAENPDGLAITVTKIAQGPVPAPGSGFQATYRIQA